MFAQALAHHSRFAGAAGATVLLTVGGNWNLTTGTCPLCGSLTGTFGSTSRTVLP